MDQFKNYVFILRSLIKKCDKTDEEYVKQSIEYILSKIFDFYIENRNNLKIIYNIDSCYKKYFKDSYEKFKKKHTHDMQV